MFDRRQEKIPILGPLLADFKHIKSEPNRILLRGERYAPRIVFIFLLFRLKLFNFKGAGAT